MTGPPLGVDAVLFDLDGLLIDSEPLWHHVEAAVFADLAGPGEWTATQAAELIGNPLPVSAARLARAAGSPASTEETLAALVDGMARALSAGAPFKPGALALLGGLRASGVPLGLVSSSYRQILDVVLRLLPRHTFGVSVAGDEVRRTKPDPEPYRAALAALGARAGRTLVLEDSATGARSAQAAGCHVVVVPDLAPLPADHPWPQAASLADLDPHRLGEYMSG